MLEKTTVKLYFVEKIEKNEELLVLLVSSKIKPYRENNSS